MVRTLRARDSTSQYQWCELLNALCTRHGLEPCVLPGVSRGDMHPLDEVVTHPLARLLFHIRTSPAVLTPEKMLEMEQWVEGNICKGEIHYVRKVFVAICWEACAAYRHVDVCTIGAPRFNTVPLHQLLPGLTRTSALTKSTKVGGATMTQVVPAYPAMCFPYLHSVAAYLGVWEYKMPPPRGYFDGVYCTSIEASRLQQGQQSYRIAKYRTHRDVTMSMVKAMAAGELLNDIQLPDDRVSLDQFKALLPDVHSDSLQEVVLRLAWRVIRQNSSAQYLSSLPKDQIRRMNARILEDGPSGVVHLADLLVTRRFRVMDQVAARQQIQEVALTSKTHLEPHSLRQQIFRCREESTSQPHFPSSRCRRFSRRN